jgi:hypothetical protein
MANVTKLYVYYYDKREWKSPVDHGERLKIEITPSGPNAIQMKLDVARVLKKFIRKIKKYYVVAEVEKSDGTYGYRTVVPMVDV